MSKSDDLLERMRRTSNGWKPVDFRTLYEGFSFIAFEGGNHTTYKNAEFGLKVAQVPRHNALKPYLAREAVKLIDEIVKLRAEQD